MHPRNSAQPARQRSFSHGGQRWTVAESAADSSEGACLVFATGHLRRRVRDYPSGWPALSDDELAVLGSSRLPRSPEGMAMSVEEMLQELLRVSAGGGERNAVSLARFEDVAAELRGAPVVDGFFRAKIASATAWAGLLFSSWRHRKYDNAGRSGAQRVRDFIGRDLRLARQSASAATAKASDDREQPN